MGHRAAIYTVRVRKRGKPNSFLPLGDIDEQGTYLGDVLREIFGSFISTDPKSNKEVSCSSRKLDGEDLKLVLHHGEGGVAADIMNSVGQLRLHQVPDDKQLLRCGSLFRLPKNETIGLWAVHINNNRGVTGLVQREMTKRFRDRVSDLMLIVRPSVPSEVIAGALADGQLDTVKLVKFDKPSDLKDAGKWVAAGTEARIELRIRAAEKAKRLLPDLVRKAMSGNSQAFGQIVQFEGMKFDSAKFEIAVDGGTRRRTFNIQRPEAGHPFTADIEPVIEDGEPTDASIFEELAEVISEMA